MFVVSFSDLKMLLRMNKILNLSSQKKRCKLQLGDGRDELGDC